MADQMDSHVGNLRAAIPRGRLTMCNASPVSIHLNGPL